VVTGQSQIPQSELGMVPLALRRGALAVEEPVRLSLHVEATRIGKGPEGAPSEQTTGRPASRTKPCVGFP
jgi:hypothetical protein